MERSPGSNDYSSEPPLRIRPEGDKVMRMSAQTAKIEAGAVDLPHHAPWLDDLKSELLAFPLGLHDDQVDSISQALNWLSYRRPEPMWSSLPPLGSSRSGRFGYQPPFPYP